MLGESCSQLLYRRGLLSYCEPVPVLEVLMVGAQRSPRFSGPPGNLIGDNTLRCGPQWRFPSQRSTRQRSEQFSETFVLPLITLFAGLRFRKEDIIIDAAVHNTSRT